MIFTSATVELKVNVATPFPSVDAEAGVMVFPVPLAVTLTEAFGTGLSLPSRTTTVMVLCPPTGMFDGFTETSLLAELGAPASAVAVNSTVPTPETTALTVLRPVPGPRVHVVLARP
jgi:hypothetical protein